MNLHSDRDAFKVLLSAVSERVDIREDILEKDYYVALLLSELDDSSHDREDRQERDAFVDQVLVKAGLPLLHVRAQAPMTRSSLLHRSAKRSEGRSRLLAA